MAYDQTEPAKGVEYSEDAPSERDKSEVESALQYLEGQEKRVEQLRERLSKVLRPEGPETADKAQPTPEPYRVSERVRTSTARISSVLTDILERLEL